MERIVLEVDDKVAKAWRDAPSDKRRDISNKINIRMSKELFEYDKAAFLQYLDGLRNEMAERGLTQEILDDILKDEA
ncbi:hypothetical protein [Mucilaginibacter gotjawali]|uniref:Uncharacterized protein n=2 Tax=Mucilaginibacter gotjawali TaxID=1550579 RepID=A0A839SIP1_9SPHI|nr:hypothetical protein [Mucilaginibacter gotjawali]MBB3057706.1 hypothetical protein [Mucilaginibacter gotjawali]BAU52509.1 hypothetical protein MgSA37_00670 [Mucilaginibacter gotjawali]